MKAGKLFFMAFVLILFPVVPGLKSSHQHRVPQPEFARRTTVEIPMEDPDQFR